MYADKLLTLSKHLINSSTRIAVRKLFLFTSIIFEKNLWMITANSIIQHILCEKQSIDESTEHDVFQKQI